MNTAVLGDLGIDGDSIVPFFLPVQFDHRRLALFRHIRAQHVGGVLCNEAANRDILVARNIHNTGDDGKSNDGHRRAQQPGQAVTPTNPLGPGITSINSWRLGRVGHRIAECVQRIEQGQQNTRKNGGLKERADRNHSRLAQIGQGVCTTRGLSARFLCCGIQVTGQSAQQNNDD